jgi:hypothetical protein
VELQLRSALPILLSLLLSLASGPAAWSSDWEEEDNRRSTNMPPVAPNYPRARSSSQPTQIDDESNAEGPGDRTAVYVSPKGSADGGGAAPLQANVSKWGLSGQTAGGQLSGAASNFQEVPASFPLKVEARSVPPSTFRSWLEKNHSRFALSTSTMNPLSVLEVKGQWDNSDHTLRSLGIRHNTIKKGKLVEIPLDDVRVLVVNCAGNVPSEAYQRVRDFVARGGYLLSTDWTVHNLLEKAFPGYIAWNSGKADGKVVDAQVVDPDPVLFAGAVRQAGWKVDDGSQTIKVLRPGVRVLVRSRQIAKDDPDHQGILAVVFSFGRGQVMHLVGHFDNNAGLAFNNMLPDPAPEIGISLRQALAANFLLAGLGENTPGR